LLASAGGVVVSYFEWAQNRAGFYWDEERVMSRLQAKMVHGYERVKGYADLNDLPLRDAGYAIAIEKIVRGLSSRGVQ
jgi:glutamate dehydrogenase/leucine dehydrogenase